jgi:alkylhydroperoxidase/carboxymuconolactone decarboxylase family protein YurZ
MFVGIANHNNEVLEGLLHARGENLGESGLDAKTYSMVNIAALIAISGPSASYAWQIALALDAGVTAEEILGLLVALNPLLGNAKVVAAAPELASALGIDLSLLNED